MPLETLLPLLLLAQAIVGGIDTLLNHEWIEKLPYRASARAEIGWHAVREAIYGSLFGGLAWFAWHGWTAWLIAVLLAGEIIVTASDEFIENHTRVLPQNERVLHVFLTLNLGLLVAVLVPTLLRWSAEPAGLVPLSYGMLSWLLSACSLAAFAWSVRDTLAYRRLGQSSHFGGQRSQDPT